MSGKYKNPALTVDIELFSIINNALNILLIQRKNPPFVDRWAIPGGFVEYDEEIGHAALRELEEETSIREILLEQVHTFGTPGRDPRGRTISVVYFALINASNLTIKADTDAKAVKWFSIEDLPEMAFDHAEIIDFTVNFLRQRLENTQIVKPLIPEEFDIEELQNIYEIILNKSFAPDDFRQKIIETGLLEKTQNQKYSFSRKKTFAKRFG